MKNSIYILFFTLFMGTLVAQSVVNTGQVKAELVSEQTAIQPGKAFSVALRLTLEDHWHVYWQNPGEAGFPPAVDWELPEGFAAGEMQFPYPHRKNFGDLINYGYEGTVLFIFDLTAPQDLFIGETVELKASTSWLVCKEECIPQGGDVSLTLPVAETPAPDHRWVQAFAETRAQHPLESSDWTIETAYQDSMLLVNAIPPLGYEGKLTELSFFPYSEDLIEHSTDQKLTASDKLYQLAMPLAADPEERPDSVAGVLVSDDGWRGSGSEKALHFDVPVSESIQAVVPAARGEVNSLAWALLLAFTGGMILNLMPCVLPVLSIKILGFVEQAGEERSKILNHGLIFTLGVVASFLALAAVLLVLRAGGEQLGWGFQLQSPGFLVLISVFLFLFGLSLFGVFEIGTSLMGVGQNSSNQSGAFGTFMSGVTATVVATPCTAPFMGSALGYTLTQPAAVALLVFGVLGLGMAFPYLLLSAMPQLLRFVPRPGPWMETLKQFMGFLLMATVIWLAWVLGLQTSSDGVIYLLLALLVAGMAAWVLGKWGNIARAKSVRRVGLAMAFLMIAGAIWLPIGYISELAPATAQAATTKGGGDGIQWEAFSPSLVNELREAGTPIFIDFTAAWCLSCQVNKKVAFSSSAVQQEFEKLGVQALVADWTSRDETITRALAEFGRNSVPLYVLYGTDKEKDPIILPEILTPDIVLDALKEIN